MPGRLDLALKNFSLGAPTTPDQSRQAETGQLLPGSVHTGGLPERSCFKTEHAPRAVVQPQQHDMLTAGSYLVSAHCTAQILLQPPKSAGKMKEQANQALFACSFGPLSWCRRRASQIVGPGWRNDRVLGWNSGLHQFADVVLIPPVLVAVLDGSLNSSCVHVAIEGWS
jgi:hypothetical protein